MTSEPLKYVPADPQGNVQNLPCIALFLFSFISFTACMHSRIKVHAEGMPATG